MSTKVVCFGTEKVTLGAQAFKSYSVTEILSTCFLGEYHSKSKDREMKVETAKQYTAHITSRRRAMEIFTLKGLCAVDFEYPDHNRSICGRVNVVRGDKNVIGYILDEDAAGRWKLLLATNEICWLSSSDKSISEYWPIRLFVRLDGNVKMSFNRLCIDKNDHIVSAHVF